MSRQLRRHPVATKPTKQQRPVKPILRGPRPAAPREGGSRTLADTLRPAWVEGVISELRKVVWPTWQEAWNLTLVVIIVCIAFGIGLGILDYVYSWIIQHTIVG